MFTQLKAQLSRLLDPALPPGPDSYVRMAYWGFDLDLHLDAINAGKTLGQLLKEIADRGFRVELIIWQPALIDLAGGKFKSERMASDQDGANLRVKRAIDGYKNLIKVYCEVYNGWVAATSNHQKMTIVSCRGKLSALVGGINLDAWYWDDDRHSFKPEYERSGGAGAIHDTAVLVEGPATLLIEEEWLRRWASQPASAGRTIVRGEAAKNAAAGSSPIKLLTTNSEKWTGREVDIQHELKGAISGASQYMYFENYAFADPGLVTKLCDTLKTKPSLRVIVCVPAATDATFGYLTRLAMVKASLVSGTGFTLRSGTTIQRAACSKWELKETWRSGITATVANRWLENDYFEYQLTTAATAVQVKLNDIIGVVAPQITFYAPSRNNRPIYVHSKLAIFDDATVFIGTANFTYRSMRYDGEMSLRIDDASFARRVRDRIFAHWGITNAANVATRDLSSESHSGTRLAPLTLGDYDGWRNPPSGLQNYTFF